MPHFMLFGPLPEADRTHWIRGSTASGRTGSGVHEVSVGPAHPERDADGVSV